MPVARRDRRLVEPRADHAVVERLGIGELVTLCAPRTDEERGSPIPVSYLSAARALDVIAFGAGGDEDSPVASQPPSPRHAMHRAPLGRGARGRHQSCGRGRSTRFLEITPELLISRS